MRKNKKYSPELKIAAVKSYLAGEGSLIQTCKYFSSCIFALSIMSYLHFIQSNGISDFGICSSRE